MPNRVTLEKAKAIAAEYILTCQNKHQTLINVGYSPSYALKNSIKLWDNVLVKSEISRLQAKTALKTDVTILSIQQELADLKLKAVTKGDLGTALGCIVASGKTVAAFSDNLNIGDVEKQREIEAEVLAEAKRISHIVLQSKLLPERNTNELEQGANAGIPAEQA